MSFRVGEKRVVLGKMCAGDTSLQLCSYPHPHTSKPSYFLLGTNNVYELQKMSDSDKCSLFIGDFVSEDDTIYITNRIDPLFILIPSLVANRVYSPTTNKVCFTPLSQTLSESWHQNLLSLQNTDLSVLCDTREIPNEPTMFALTDDKLLQWVRAKVERIASQLPHIRTIAQSNNYTNIALGIISEYLSPKLFTDVCESYQTKPNIILKENRKRKLSQISSIDKTNESDSKDLSDDIDGATDGPQRKKLRVSRQWNDENEDKNKSDAAVAVVGSSDFSVGMKQLNVGAINQKEKPRTIANKQLAKANTRGMRSMMTYFGGGKKK